MPAQQARDPEVRAPSRTACCIRAPGTLGGCTAHNAMILVVSAQRGLGSDRRSHRRSRRGAPTRCGSTSSGSRTAGTGRSSGSGSTFGIDPSRHGWSGWLQTEKAVARRSDRATTRCARSSPQSVEQRAEGVRRAVAGAARSARRSERLARRRARRGRRALHAADDRRPSARRRARAAARRGASGIPDRLRIELHALATRVLFDDGNRAIGVEYQKGERLYAAHPGASTARRRDARWRGRAAR